MTNDVRPFGEDTPPTWMARVGGTLMVVLMVAAVAYGVGTVAAGEQADNRRELGYVTRYATDLPAPGERLSAVQVASVARWKRLAEMHTARCTAGPLYPPHQAEILSRMVRYRLPETP